jgi:hypothetical protein
MTEAGTQPDGSGAEKSTQVGGTDRQPIMRRPGRVRRAQLLPAPDTDPNPDPPKREEGGMASAADGVTPAAGVNDARLKLDRPPHW